MAVAQLVTGQGRGQQHQWVALRVAFMHKRNKGFVQCAQPAALNPTLKQQQQIGGVFQGLELGQAFGR